MGRGRHFSESHRHRPLPLLLSPGPKKALGIRVPGCTDRQRRQRSANPREAPLQDGMKFHAQYSQRRRQNRWAGPCQRNAQAGIVSLHGSLPFRDIDGEFDRAWQRRLELGSYIQVENVELVSHESGSQIIDCLAQARMIFSQQSEPYLNELDTMSPSLKRWLIAVCLLLSAGFARSSSLPPEVNVALLIVFQERCDEQDPKTIPENAAAIAAIFKKVGVDKVRAIQKSKEYAEVLDQMRIGARNQPDFNSREACQSLRSAPKEIAQGKW